MAASLPNGSIKIGRYYWSALILILDGRDFKSIYNIYFMYSQNEWPFFISI